MNPGIYGYWEFTIRKLTNGRYKDTYFEMYGEVTKVDEAQITIIDCYDITYRILWSRLQKFEKQEKPINNKL